MGVLLDFIKPTEEEKESSPLLDFVMDTKEAAPAPVAGEKFIPSRGLAEPTELLDVGTPPVQEATIKETGFIDLVRESPSLGDRISEYVSDKTLPLSAKMSEEEKVQFERALGTSPPKESVAPKVLGGLARVTSGLGGWHVDLITNPPKAIVGFADALIHSAKKWAEIRHVLDNEPEAKKKFVDEISEMPVDYMAELLMLPLAFFGGRHAVKGKLGKARAQKVVALNAETVKMFRQAKFGDRAHMLEAPLVGKLGDFVPPKTHKKMLEVSRKEIPDAVQRKAEAARPETETIKETPKVEAEAVKQPWEMSKRDWVYEHSDSWGNKKKMNVLYKQQERAVEKAIAEGKIKSHPDYPDLAKAVPEAPKAEAGEVISLKDSPVLKGLDAAKIAAKERINKRLFQGKATLTTGVGKGTFDLAGNLADLSIVGAAVFNRGSLRYRQFAKEMIAEYGNVIKPHIKVIYNESRKYLKESKPPPFQQQKELVKELQSGAKAPREGSRFTGSEGVASWGTFNDKKPFLFDFFDMYIEKVEGGLSFKEKAALPDQMAPLTRDLVSPMREMDVLKIDWTMENKGRARNILKGLSRKELKLMPAVTNEISQRGAYIDPALMAERGSIAKIISDAGVKDPSGLVAKAQEVRKLFDHVLKEENLARQQRGQKPIPYRKYYTPDMIKEVSLLGEWMRETGETGEMWNNPKSPDFIIPDPNKPVIPHEFQKKFGLKDKEMRMDRLLDRYIDVAARDIFNTSIIENNKAIAKQLRGRELYNISNVIRDYTAETYGGIRAPWDRSLASHAPRIAEKVSDHFRGTLARAVFPLNVAWNMFVQTTSASFTIARFGTWNSGWAMKDWFTEPALRNQIKGTHTMKVKGKVGVARQEASEGLTSGIQVKRGGLKTAEHWANYFTRQVEHHITGWSIASAMREGQKMGLRGNALMQYGSRGGARTQSMYNREGISHFMRNKSVRTAFPFQGFAVEGFNFLREYTTGGTGSSVKGKRAITAVRAIAAMTAANYISSQVTGRKPWDVGSFIPFYGAISGDPRTGMASPVGVGKEMIKGVSDIVEDNSWSRMRRWMLKYGTAAMGIPGGTQLDRVVDGIIVLAQDEGEIRDKSGKVMYEVEDNLDKLKLMFSGRHTTDEAREYWDKRSDKIEIPITEEPSTLTDVLESVPVVGQRVRLSPKPRKKKHRARLW